MHRSKIIQQQQQQQQQTTIKAARRMYEGLYILLVSFLSLRLQSPRQRSVMTNKKAYDTTPS